jgi:hypothetical protein
MAEPAVQDREETPTQQEGAPQPPAAETALEKRQSPAASIGFGMNARNWDEGFRIANQLAKSNLVPKIYKEQAQDIVVAMQLGAELGLPPMQSLQSIAVINGKPGIYGDGFLGVIMAAPAYAKHTEYYLVGVDKLVEEPVEENGNVQIKQVKRRVFERRDALTTDDLAKEDTTAVCSFWRRGNPDPFTATFSIGDAKRASLLGKEGPWRNYPSRMLKMRARGFAGRDAFAGELRGMKTAEEIQDTPIDVTVTSIPFTPAEPVRRSEKDSTSAPDTAGADQPQAQEPPRTEKAAGPEKAAGGSRTSRAAAAGQAPGQITKNVSILETMYVGKPKNGVEPYHEIKGVVLEDNKPGLGFTWITRDEQLAKLADSCAGTDHLFTVTWHVEGGAPDKTTKDLKVITGLQAAS